MTDVTPKPCPWCKKSSVKVQVYRGTYGGFMARMVCQTVDCRAEGPVSAHLPMESYAASDALRRWNQRAEEVTR